MRSIAISMAVILFCLSVNIVNRVDTDYNTEIGRPLFGWAAGSWKSTADYSDYSDENINGTVGRYTRPDEQPAGFETMQFFDDLTKKYTTINLIMNTLIYSTVGFHIFLNTLGRPDTGIIFIPLYIGVPLSVLVNINHALAVLQYIRGFNIKNAA
jgi:hypothetical protein